MLTNTNTSVLRSCLTEQGGYFLLSKCGHGRYYLLQTPGLIFYDLSSDHGIRVSIETCHQCLPVKKGIGDRCLTGPISPAKLIKIVLGGEKKEKTRKSFCCSSQDNLILHCCHNANRAPGYFWVPELFCFPSDLSFLIVSP